MIKIDTYYDVTCDNCAKSRSTDYGWGFWELDKASLRKALSREGWKYRSEKTLCPECATKEEDKDADNN